jgi:membrane protein YqaA with SNARE-associated domain
VLFVYELSQEERIFWLLLLAASAGNTLGSFVNYGIGRFAMDWALRKRYVKQAALQKGHRLMDRYGFWALLLTWAPVIGGPIMFAAGAARLAWWKFLIVVAIAKTLRYGVLAYGVQAYM